MFISHYASSFRIEGGEAGHSFMGSIRRRPIRRHRMGSAGAIGV